LATVVAALAAEGTSSECGVSSGQFACPQLGLLDGGWLAVAVRDAGALLDQGIETATDLITR
jgi:hypothetical protein